MSEKEIHLAVCEYIKLQYPKVIFTTDLSGIKLTIGQAKQVKKMRSENAIPDLLILKPNIAYHGLFIELKKENVKLYKKDGSFVSDHIEQQFKMRLKLNELGYFANFAFGFDEAKKMIESKLLRKTVSLKSKAKKMCA